MTFLYKIIALTTVMLLSTAAFSQGRALGRGGVSPATRVNSGSMKRQMAVNNVRITGAEKREQARVNGALNANENAAEQAKNKANENSVLEPGSPKEPGRNNKDKEDKSVKEKKEKTNG